MGVGWRLTVDSFMSQFNSGLLLALPGSCFPGVRAWKTAIAHRNGFWDFYFAPL
jgi:hypothetical protein